MTDPKTPTPGPGGDAPDETDEAAATAAPEGEAESEAAGPAPPPRHRLAQIAIGVGALLVLLAASYISWPLWQGALPGWLRAGLAPVMDAGRGGGNEQVAALAARLDRTDAALAALRKDVAALPQTDPTVAGRVTALENTIAELKADVVEKAGGTELARLAARVDALEKRPAASAGTDGGSETASAIAALRAQSARRMAGLEKENDALRASVAELTRRVGALGAQTTAAVAGAEAANALLLAVGQLREATRGTAGFADALDAVRSLAKGDAAVEKPAARLAPHAGSGVADLTTLRARFGAVADAIARAAAAPAGSGWLDRTIARLSDLVTVRRVGEAAAARDDAQGLVARAELRLAAGDLAGAVAALDKLDGAPAKAAAGWLAQARARLAVDKAVDELFAHALAAVSAGRRG